MKKIKIKKIQFLEYNSGLAIFIAVIHPPSAHLSFAEGKQTLNIYYNTFRFYSQFDFYPWLVLHGPRESLPIASLPLLFFFFIVLLLITDLSV